MHLIRRPRRLRRNESVRSLVRETHLNVNDLIQPVFVLDSDNDTETIDSMPGILRYGQNPLEQYVERLCATGIKAIALFPKTDPKLKTDTGSEALNPENLICRTIRNLKKAVPEVEIFADVALDPYTTHGHDGLIDEDGKTVINDETVEILKAMALNLAQAGVDWVAPSDMMDGRIGAIREELDHGGFHEICIMAYSAKYASALYGPFRDAVGSAQAAGTHHLDKMTYQMDPANRREAILEAAMDIEEGADSIMVKPAGMYLDIIRDLRESTTLPLAAYQVSGEYAQIQAAATMGWLDLKKTRDESLLSIKRAGADLILTYFAEALALDQAH